jgi:hemolysin activation/secretion protein
MAKRAFLIAFLFIVSGLSPVFAQAPASTRAGAVEQQMEQALRLQENKAKLVKPKIKIEVEEKRAPEAVVEEKVEGGVLIKKFLLNGVTLFKPEDFLPILAPYKDKHLELKEFNTLAAAIQKFYRTKGYITTYVYIPVQKIANNTLEIRVIEGCVGTIEVEGGKYFSKEFVREKFHIREGDTVLYKDLMKSMRSLNTNPDRTVKAVLLPGERKDTTDILLKVSDHNPQHAFVEYNNRGTKYTGKQRFGAGYVNNNLLGVDDVLTVRYQRSNEKLNGGSFDYNLPVSHLNTRLGTYFSYVSTDLVGGYEVLDAHGWAWVGGSYVNQPFIDQDHVRGNAGFGLDIKHSKNFLLGTETSSDNVSVAKLNLSLDGDDGWGATYFIPEIDFGIPYFDDALGPKDTSASRLGAGGEFVKYTLNAGRRLNLPFSAFLLLNARAQYTPDKLVAGEQFYIGGGDTVRGYPELEYMGDYGFNTNVELRTPIYLLPAKCKLRDKIQMVYFWDYGKGFLRNPLVGEKGHDTLWSTGWGIRFAPWKDCYLKVDWGFPLGPKPSDNSKSTVHIWAHIDLI